MGVRGLQTFIRNNDDVLHKEFKLHDTFLVVDACNFVSASFSKSQTRGRKDLFGGDMIEYGRYLQMVFGSFKKCKIVPIFVFDGAQTKEKGKVKTREKYRRALRRFRVVMKINKLGFGDLVLPATTTTILKSIMADNNICSRQSIYEADSDIARIANELKCPVMSNDSDFFIFNLSHGLILIEDFNFSLVRKATDSNGSSDSPSNLCDNDQQLTGESSFYHYIPCRLFTQDKFVSFFPMLNKKVLPLLAILAGNDFMHRAFFANVCTLLPNPQKCGAKRMKSMLRSNREHMKLLKILFWLCNKTIDEAIKQIVSKLPQDDRKTTRQLILDNLKVYVIPTEDEFVKELTDYYKPGYIDTENSRMIEQSTPKEIEIEITTLKLSISWIRGSFERSTLNHACLDYIFRNNVYVSSHMDDADLPSAHSCQMRPIRVMLTLLRSSVSDNSRPCYRFDRLGNSYEAYELYPLLTLESFGEIPFFLYDIPALDISIRQKLLLATFHSSKAQLDKSLAKLSINFSEVGTKQICLLLIILKYISIEDPSKMWKDFRYSLFLCAVFYMAIQHNDLKFQNTIDQTGDLTASLLATTKRLELDRIPALNNSRLYNCRLMHYITQFQSAVVSFNHLNALLGDCCPRIKTERWLNSCYVYNMTESIRRGKFKIINFFDSFSKFSLLMNKLEKYCSI